MTNPRQLAPTVGLSHDGFEFLKGSFDGLKGYAVGRMTKSCRGKLYINNTGWGSETDSIEYGYRVPFGGIHIFIGKIGEPAPEPDICTDIIETARRGKACFCGCRPWTEVRGRAGVRWRDRGLFR